MSRTESTSPPRAERGPLSRKVRKVIIGCAVLCAMSIVAAVLFLDAVAARVLTSAATLHFGTETTVRSVHLGLFDGRSTLTGLQVGQPAGFGEGPMLVIDHASITAGLAELLSHDIVIESIEVDGLSVHIVEANGLVNAQVVADTLTKEKDATPPTAAPATSETPSGGTVAIRALTVSGIRVSARGGSVLSQDQTVEVTIPDLVVTDLGTKTKVSDIAAQLSAELMNRLLVAIVQAKVQGFPQQMLTGLQSASSSLADATSSLLNQTGSAIQGTIEGAGEAIKGLFGGGK